jgi:carbamoyl-phosphate synthase small subunit
MYLATETGLVTEGRCRSRGSAKFELVFTTAYTGYEESLTDPSYNGQGLLFSYPLIGNYGVDERRFESPEVQPAAIFAKEMTDDVASLCDSHDVPAIDHIETRDLVRAIRENGSMKAAVAPTKRRALALCADAVTQGVRMVYDPPNDLPARSGDGRPIVTLLDCGVKESMIERMNARGATVVRLPWDVNASHLRQYDPDLLFVSNGPGNPEEYKKAQETISYWHDEIPIAGICLGQQLISLALGGETEKMKFGHRGVNQPVYDTRTKRVRMTTQNHSHEVSVVPDCLDLVQYNVNDNSPEGLESDSIICRQYHPEANPGPNDSLDFFDDVLDLAED